MNASWIETLLAGSLDIELPRLTIAGEGIGTLNGSGRISWRADSGITIHAHTECGDLVNRALLGTVGIPGTLFEGKDYLELRGTSHAGSAIRTQRWVFDGCSLHSESQTAIWERKVDCLWQDHAATTPYPSEVLHGLIGPSPHYWPRPTRTTVENPFFQSDAYIRDWMLAETSLGTIAARHRSDEWFEVCVTIAEAAPVKEPHRIMRAIGDAFGFIMGRHCSIRGYEHQKGHTTTCYVRNSQSRSSGNTLLQPLGTNQAYCTDVESLLGKAIDYFSMDDGEKVARHLRLCWDTVGNAWPTRLVVASTCLEGLLGMVGGKTAIAASAIAADDLQAMKTLLSTNPLGFSERMLKRLEGFSRNPGKPRPIDILEDWKARNVLGVTQADITAWKEIRNPAAHGGLIEPAASSEALQDQITRFYRVVNLMNRIILQLVGYGGPYVDYAQRWFPECEFPAALPGSLELR